MRCHHGYGTSRPPSSVALRVSDDLQHIVLPWINAALPDFGRPYCDPLAIAEGIRAICVSALFADTSGLSATEQPESEFDRAETTRIVSERPRIETICLVFISFAAAVFLLRYAQAIVLPFVLALLLFYGSMRWILWCPGCPALAFLES